MRISDWISDVCSSDLGLSSLGHLRRDRGSRRLCEPAPAGCGPVGRSDGDSRLDVRWPGGQLRHDEEALSTGPGGAERGACSPDGGPGEDGGGAVEDTYELQSIMRNSYAGFCLKKKN